MNPQEEIIVSSFITANKRYRWRLLLNHPKRRRDALNELYHLGDLDPVCATWKKQGTNEVIIALSTAEGSDAKVYVMSTSRELDGQVLPLAEAVHKAGDGSGDAAILLCLSTGALGFYFGENPAARALLKCPKAK